MNKNGRDVGARLLTITLFYTVGIPDKMVHLFIFAQPFFEGLDKEGQLSTPHFVRVFSEWMDLSWLSLIRLICYTPNLYSQKSSSIRFDQCI